MKLSSAVLVLVDASTFTSAHDAGRGDAGKRKLGRNPTVAPEALLRSARPYKKGANTAASFRRRLDGDDDGFEIDGSYSIKFEQCVDLKLYDEDLFDEDVIEYTQAGNIASTQSYALFHVCQENDCYYESEDDLYIVDLATYVTNVASYYATAKSSYCAACATYYGDFCVAQEADDAAAADDDDAAANADDAAAAYDDVADYYAGDDAGDDAAERKLEKQRRTQNYIECDVCEAYGCVNEGDDDGQQQDDGDDAALELIEDISQCLNTGLNWNNDDLYVGFMCSPYDGDGVELAIFLDDQCTVYTNLKAFSDIPSWYIYNDEDIFTEAETYIKNAFTETTSCRYEEFGDPAYQNNGDDDAAADDAAAADDDGYAVNDFCDGLFAEGPIAFNSCVQNDDQNNNNQNNANDDDQYNWYTYDMNYDNAQDLEEVCVVLQQMEGEYEYQYDEENSGTWNDHSGWWGDSTNNKKGRWSFLSGGGGTNKEVFSASATSGIMIFFYVLLGFAMAVGILFIIGVREKKRRERIEPVYQGGKLV